MSAANPPRPPPRAPRPRAASSAALLQELHTHQAELESQNEELRRTQLDLAAARDRYLDLYDFAPVGYFTLDRDGRILEANLTGADLLAEERRTLLGQPFARYVCPADRDRWHLHLRLCVAQADSQRIELVLQRRGGAAFHGQIDCLRIDAGGTAPQLRITLSDVSLREQSQLNRRIADAAVDAREAERRRVARELHEELGQRLSAVKMGLASLPPGAAGAGPPGIAEMMDTLDEAVAVVRRIATELGPLMLDDLGLNAAIDWLVRDTAQRTGLDIRLDLDETDPPLDSRDSMALFRALQEALAGLVGQPGVEQISVALRRVQDELRLCIDSRAGPDAANARPTAVLAARGLSGLAGRLEPVALDGTGRLCWRLPLAIAPRPENPTPR